jgi:hypothetical protein
LFYPERCGQPHSHQIDWKIAALDALGLLLFFVPGVVAFAVDFYTGAIYLPLHEAYPCYGAWELAPPGPQALPQYPAVAPAAAAPVAAGQPPRGQELGLKRLAIPREQLQREHIEQIVSQHVGRQVSLDDDRVRASQLAQIDQFDEQATRHRSDSDFGFEVRSFFENLMGA